MGTGIPEMVDEEVGVVDAVADAVAELVDVGLAHME